MTEARTPIPYALTAYGLPHVMGYLPTRDGVRYASPMGITGLMDAAVEMGLAGIDCPLPLPETHPTKQILDDLQTRGLKLVVEYGGILSQPVDALKACLSQAAELGSPVVRAILSQVLCGDRRTLGTSWEAHLTQIVERLREVLPLAESLGICIAVENHQDATSDDLLRLADAVKHSPSFGVTLDTGNPLAVGEEPVVYARNIAPLIRHLHLKDYTMHFCEEGYRLVRCAAGTGVVDFPAILALARANGHDILPGIEIAAQQTRTIPFLDEAWWSCYPPSPATSLIGALGVLWKLGRPAEEPYSSAWERGEDSETVAIEEWDVVRASVDYFHNIRCPT